MVTTRQFVTALMFAALPVCATAEVYDLPPEGNDVVGAVTTITARAEDTLLDIARRHGLGYEDIVRANPDVDTWLPGEGTLVTLPTRYVLPHGPREGVILNLAEYRMYYYPVPEAGEPAVVMTYPISIGRMDWETPLGRTSIISKVRNPAWYPPESIRAEHAADGDPLPRVVPAGVGMRVTHGCIRMFPEDIDYLFGNVGLNTGVRIINEPVKIGWNGDELVVEVHRTLESSPAPAADETAESSGSEDAAVESDETVVVDAAPPARDAMTALTEQFVLATNERPAELDWDIAEQLLERADGIPAIAGRKIKDAATSAASE